MIFFSTSKIKVYRRFFSFVESQETLTWWQAHGGRPHHVTSRNERWGSQCHSRAHQRTHKSYRTDWHARGSWWNSHDLGWPSRKALLLLLLLQSVQGSLLPLLVILNGSRNRSRGSLLLLLMLLLRLLLLTVRLLMMRRLR